MKEHIEEIDEREFKVISLPPDSRLQPSQVKKRTLFQSLSSREKQEFFRRKRHAAAKKRKKRK